jgi:small subunit ribosomal protein S3
MGTKVHPKIFRTGVIYSWGSKWFSGNRREYSKLLQQDTKIRKFLKKQLKEASVDRVEIERTVRALTVTIHSAKPGAIIGRGGAGIEDLKVKLIELLAKGKSKKEQPNVNLNVVEVTKPNLSSHIVLQSMIADIERRMPFRRVLKTHMDRIQKAGAKGVKLQVKGRLNGAEIAREEKLSWGSVPLHNLRADIDYASGFARTLFGTIGIKVWIYRGDIFEVDQNRAQQSAPPPSRFRGRAGGPRRR